MNISRRNILTGGAALMATGCTNRLGSPSSYLSQVVHPKFYNTVFHWVDLVLQQTRDQRIAPPRAAYNFAMPMTAGFLAANSITGAYDEHFGIGAGPRGANPEVAYGVAFATAAAEVFDQPFLMERRAFHNRFPDGPAKSLGIEWGRKVGMHIVKMRNKDGSEPSKVNYYLDRYQRRKDIMQWRPTGPFYSAKPGPAFGSFARGLFPGQGQITPWTMQSGSQFRVSGFYHPQSPEFAQEYEMARSWGGKHSQRRTADEEEIALFWEDGPWGITPPGHFIYLASQILQDQNLSFMQLAKVFALMGMTQCDASISAWDNKYHHDILRPETAIRTIGSDFYNADPRVQRQANWQSYIPTPEFPAYTSGHSTFAAAGCEMIAQIIGTDRISLSGMSPDTVLWPQLKNRRRHWNSLNQIAEECGMSRIYGGVHWHLDHTQGIKAGRAIARQAYTNIFPKRNWG